MEIRLAKPASRAGAGNWLGLAGQKYMYQDAFSIYESYRRDPGSVQSS